MKKSSRTLRYIFVVVILLAWIMLTGFMVYAAEPFELHLLDVGQGQCVLIEVDDHYMLIDGGGRSSSSFVVSYLKQQGTDHFDLVAVSHYDEDHMSGVIGALSVFPADEMGNQIRRMAASCVMYESGVDAKDNIIIEYENGGMASLYASMTDQSNRTGTITGPKGYIEVSNINNPQEIRVYEQDGYGSKLIRKLSVPDQINGYEYEVRSALAAIEAGQVECPEMPHGETLEIMRQMDECRKQFGLVFPCE